MRVHWSVRNIPRLEKQKDDGDEGWFTGEQSHSAGVADGVSVFLCMRIRHA
ncbi:hypothetical protein [Candidatus Poseidonia alphae]|uniref:hypothetical protein n=1 Tax=Candidatus Poseidonia alphae TaxID=1915863 RepID=UPI0030C72A4E